jgi:histidinol-phosphate aminotransferase
MSSLPVSAQPQVVFGPGYIRALAPYVGGKPIEETAREYGLDAAKIVKLASNENPLGMPQSAKDAMVHAMDELARYPDDNAYDLKAALSCKLDVPAQWITLGSGSSDILMMAAMATAGAGGTVIYSQYGFVVYALATQKIGATAKVIPVDAAMGHDLPATLAAIDSNTKLIYVANPCNQALNNFWAVCRHMSPWCWMRPMASISSPPSVRIPLPGCAVFPM